MNITRVNNNVYYQPYSNNYYNVPVINRNYSYCNNKFLIGGFLSAYRDVYTITINNLPTHFRA